MKMYIRLLVLINVLVFTGCSHFGKITNYSNSGVAGYLYPKEQVVKKISVPHLNLPLRVGIAFTPEQYNRSLRVDDTRKTKFMQKLSEKFIAYEFVETVEIIPSGYLRAEGGFENVDQLKRIFDIDIIALVSYDQTFFSDETFASISYWTIVGAYLIPGTKNSVHTLFDLSVFDINSRNLLFRAPGTGMEKAYTTMVNTEARRKIAVKSFESAEQELMENFPEAIDNFMNRIKSKPEKYKVTAKPGYSGAGSFNGITLLSLILVLLITNRQKRNYAS